MKEIKIMFEQDKTVEGIEVKIRASENDGEVSALIDRICCKQTELMTVTCTDGVLINIVPDDIVSVSVSGKLVKIVTENGTYTVRQSLQSLENKLATRRFARISRCEIVNLDKVIKYDFTLGGTLRLELTGGAETWASRRNIPIIRKKLINTIF